ncbi:aldehyde dehydrogenase family protein [Herbiconiux liukaitaii]|uniref:aldehyde dehydrogenase family protein n=1 Tax=Herbiconiux liukaitaii TaxID=3342799 RepID=UPI0035B6E78B
MTTRILSSERPSFDDVSPIDGSVVGTFPARSPEEAVEVVAAARTAASEWAAAPFTDRRAVLLRAADVLEEGLEETAALFASETGSVRPWAEMNVRESSATLREAAGLTSSPLGQLLPSEDPDTLNLSIRQPAGVSLSIVPWNAPLILATRASAISLAVGNAVVIRPSEEAPLTAGHLLAGALRKAGAPEGVVSVVTTAPGGGRRAIEAMIEDTAVRRVVFIGSTPVGRSIASMAGRALTPAVLELGGKNATIVRQDADLDIWAAPLAFASFANSGQVCMCTDRLLVHRSRYDELVERLSAIAADMPVGDPRDPTKALGPVINDAAADRFDELVADVRSSGGSIAQGGGRSGRYLSPTVVTGLAPQARLASEEAFLPLVEVIPFETDAQAVSLANQGDFGLIASVISKESGAAISLARQVRAGAVHVNGPSVGDEPHVPFGGLGASGLGRLGGEESVRFFTDQRTIYWHGGL